MAYLTTIAKPRCDGCLRPAGVELFNKYNSVSGRYCRGCGARALEELTRLEAERGTVEPEEDTSDDAQKSGSSRRTA